MEIFLKIAKIKTKKFLKNQKIKGYQKLEGKLTNVKKISKNYQKLFFLNKSVIFEEEKKLKN